MAKSEEKFERLTASFPAELFRRIEAAKAAGLIDTVSAFLQRAAAKELDDLVNADGVAGLRAIAGRIAELEQRRSATNRDQGVLAGRDWAKSRARGDQLRRLSAVVTGGRWEAYINDRGRHWDEIYPAMHLYCDMNGEPFSEGIDIRPALAFWSSFGSYTDSVLNPSFVDGFGCGANEIWQQVTPHLPATPASPSQEFTKSRKRRTTP